MNRFIAYGLFTSGVLVSISGAAKLPAADATFPDTYPIFIVGVLLAVAGIVMWRIILAGDRAAARQMQSDGGSGQNASALQLLADAIAPLQAFNDELAALDAQGTMQRVDAILARYVLPFAEVRQQVIDHLGMSIGAEVLVTVAYGERMLNRTWSAASDGHLPEARASLPDALAAMQEAAALASKASAAL